jgi:hypothetical protein
MPLLVQDSNQDKTALKTEEEHKLAELNLCDMVEEILKSPNRVPPDLRIDDRDLPEFANFYEFCFSSRGVEQPPFARQLAIATHLLAEWCPRCSTKAFYDITKIPVDFPAKDFPDKITYLEHGVCPTCGATKLELYKSGELNVYTELVGVAGQRSGKSALLGLIAPYIIHKWLKMQKPVQSLGLMKNSILIGTFVGLTYAKASELLWEPIRNAIANSIWFQEYHEMLTYYGEKYDQEIFKFKDTFLQYGHKNLFFHPSGPNKRTLRGATRCLSIIDELGWFPHGEENDSKERASANEVYIALDRSLKTVRKSAFMRLEEGWNNIPMALNCGISSPSSYMDKTMSLLRAHAGSSDVFTYHLASWEMNPLFTKEDFAKEYREDPVKAERDFGANPPMSENPWISDVSIIDPTMKLKKNRVSYKYKHSRSASGQSQRYAEITNVRPPSPCPRTVLAIDAGYSNNSFALSIVAPNLQKGADVLAFVEIAPERGKNVLNYTRITSEIIYPLIEEFNVGLVLADRWQSIKLLQDIESEYDIYTESYSLTADDFSYILDYMIDEDNPSIFWPKLETNAEDVFRVDLEEYPHCFKYTPVSHLYHQFTTATENHRGVVEKGMGYTDDLLRSACLAIAYCIDEDALHDYELLGNAKQTYRGAIGTKTGKNASGLGIGVRSGAGNSSGSRGLGSKG